MVDGLLSLFPWKKVPTFKFPPQPEEEELPTAVIFIWWEPAVEEFLSWITATPPPLGLARA